MFKIFLNAVNLILVQSLEMNKTIFVVLVVFLGLATFTQSQETEQKPCWGQDCTFDAKGDPLTKANVIEAVRTVDREMRRVYWYYLRGSRRLFQANIDTPNRFIHFFIYRNIIGTFLAIGSWDHQTQVSEVNTFVRLGNGDDENIQTNYEAVDIDPFVISLRMKQGQSLIEIDENGDVICVEGVFNQFCLEEVDGGEGGQGGNGGDGNGIDLGGFTAAKVNALDQYIRDNYWQYVDGAKLIHFDTIPTTQRLYALFTYINIVGTFLVIASCDFDDVIQINTFVRLGGGSKNLDNIQAIVLAPRIIAANDL